MRKRKDGGGRCNGWYYSETTKLRKKMDDLYKDLLVTNPYTETINYEKEKEENKKKMNSMINWKKD